MLSLLLFFCAVFVLHQFSDAPNPNEYSRLYQLRAVVEEHTLAIDSMIERYGHLQDKSYYRHHFYSDKSFGMTFLSIPFYWTYYRLFGPCRSNEWLRYLISVLVVALPHLLFIFLLHREYVIRKPLRAYRELVWAAYSIGTIVLPYTAMFYSHVTGAAVIGIVWIMIDRYGNRLSYRHTLILGFLLGLAAIIEYPLALVCGWLFIYVCIRLLSAHSVQKAVLRIGVIVFVALAVIGIQLFVNYRSFGNMFATGYAHKYAIDQTLYHSKGLFGVAMPAFESLWGITFSPSHGLFYFSPFLLLCIPALLYLMRNKEQRVCGWILSGIIVTFLLFGASVVDWRGGWTIGARYCIPAIPFMIVALLKSTWMSNLKRLKLFALLRVVFICSFFWSILHVVLMNATYPLIPEVIKIPLMEFSLPLIMGGDISPTVLSLFGIHGYVNVGIEVILALCIIVAVWSQKLTLFVRKRSMIILLCAAVLSGTAIGTTYFLIPEDSVEKHYYMSYVYRYLNNPVKQLEELYKLVDAVPDQLDYRADLADRLLKVGALYHAFRHTDLNLSQAPRHTKTQKIELRARTELKHASEQHRLLEQRKNQPAASPEGLFAAGRIYLAVGDLERARHYFMRAERIRKRYTGPRVLLKIIDVMQRYEKAQRN